jgi:hypothetical protein
MLLLLLLLPRCASAAAAAAVAAVVGAAAAERFQLETGDVRVQRTLARAAHTTARASQKQGSLHLHLLRKNRGTVRRLQKQINKDRA